MTDYVFIASHRINGMICNHILWEVVSIIPL